MDISKLLQSDDCFATTGLVVLLKDNGFDALKWQPETVTITMERRYGELPSTLFNKINAARSIILGNDYYQDLYTFVAFNNILSHGYLQDLIAGLYEICWGITEANLLMPQEAEAPLDILSNDVLNYILKVIELEGLLAVPAALNLVGISFDRRPQMEQVFADNPVLFEAVVKIHTLRINAFNNFTSQRLLALNLQLQSLGIDTEEILKQLPENVIG